MDHERRRSVCCCPPYPKCLDWTKNNTCSFWSSLPKPSWPSSVYIFTEKPRGSRTVSAEPLSPARTKRTERIEKAHADRQHAPTVEKRARTRVFVPFLKTFDLQMSEMSSVASNTPKAPPLQRNWSIECFDFKLWLTLWRERHVPERVLDRIVEYLRCKGNPRATTARVVRQSPRWCVHQVDDHSRLLIVPLSMQHIVLECLVKTIFSNLHEISWNRSIDCPMDRVPSARVV